MLVFKIQWLSWTGHKNFNSTGRAVHSCGAELGIQCKLSFFKVSFFSDEKCMTARIGLGSDWAVRLDFTRRFCGGVH